MVDSIAPQLNENDYLTIIWDSEPFALDIKSDCQVVTIQNPEPLGYWGHGSRTKWQKFLFGDYIMNADDDDVYTPDAMEKVRECCVDRKLYMFKMQFEHTVVWKERAIAIANIGTPCGVYPKLWDLPDWAFEYGGDFKFYEALSKVLDVEFCDHIIYKIKDA